MAVEVFKHLDGRVCERSGPTERFTYDNGEDKDRLFCNRYHNDPADGEMLGHSMRFEGVHPRSGPPRQPTAADRDRGEFGMPGVGHGRTWDVPVPPEGRLGMFMPVDGSPPELIVAELKVEDELQLRGQMNMTTGDSEGGQADRCGNIFDEAQSLFRRKNRGYGNTAYGLGARGQYADINRKLGKLKHQLWDGKRNEDDEDESMEEMLMDLMGHCALTIDFLRSGDL